MSVRPCGSFVLRQSCLHKRMCPYLFSGSLEAGKGTVARLIHQRSVHSGFKFLRVNCAEMPADLLEIELFGRENGSSNGSSKSLRETRDWSEGHDPAG